VTTDDWNKYLWGDLAVLEYGRSLRGYRDGTGTVRVFGTNGPIGWTNEEQGAGPTVVVGRKGAYRGVHYSSGPFWVIDTAFWLRPLADIDMRWAYYQLLTQDINGRDSGSAIPSLSRSDFSTFVAAVPPIQEQRAIAEVLGSLDDKILANQRTCALEEELATCVLDQAPSRIPLRDVANILRNIIDPSSLGLTMVDHFSLPAFDEQRLPVHQAGAEIRSGKQIIDDISVLVSRLNPHIPRVWYAVPKSGIFGVASTEFVVLAPQNDASAEELWACCNSASFSSELAESVTGTTGSHQRVQAADVLSTEVGDPRSLSPGQRLAIATLVKSAHHLRVETVTLATLRDALLPKLLQGELRVRDADAFVEVMG